MKPTKEFFDKFNEGRLRRLEMVREFHIAMGLSVNCSCESLEAELKLREKVIDEEVTELEVEYKKLKKGIKDYQALAKELADVEYVLLGTYVSLGDVVAVFHLGDGDVLAESRDLLVWALNDPHGVIGRKFMDDFDRIFAEVHRSNMSKLDNNGKPVVRDDGKILKGPNYSPADLSFLL